MRAFNHETSVYQVLTPYNDHRGGGGNHSHEINIFARTCGCGKWQNIKIPCSHAIKDFQNLRLDVTSYIDPMLQFGQCHSHIFTSICGAKVRVIVEGRLRTTMGA